jgi:hypothetical protein
MRIQKKGADRRKPSSGADQLVMTSSGSENAFWYRTLTMKWLFGYSFSWDKGDFSGSYGFHLVLSLSLMVEKWLDS